MTHTCLLFSAHWFCRSQGSLCHRIGNSKLDRGSDKTLPLADCSDTQKHTRDSRLSFISLQTGKLGVGCCGSAQAQGPVGLQIALLAAGMTQSSSPASSLGPGRVGPCVAELQRPPQLLYFKPQGLTVTGS